MNFEKHNLHSRKTQIFLQFNGFITNVKRCLRVSFGKSHYFFGFVCKNSHNTKFVPIGQFLFRCSIKTLKFIDADAVLSNFAHDASPAPSPFHSALLWLVDGWWPDFFETSQNWRHKPRRVKKNKKEFLSVWYENKWNKIS